MSKKPALSFWQIWNMSFGFLGIQFGFALQNANVSRIFETLGAEVENIPILWIAAPVTGLVVQPIIGHMSDKTWNRLGRRRPYFLFGAIFASIALIMMPNSPALWVAAGMLWVMDASLNVSMEPFRAFVGDMLPNEQRTRGFATQSFFIGTGAVVGSMLPYVMTNWLNVPNTAPEGVFLPYYGPSFPPKNIHPKKCGNTKEPKGKPTRWPGITGKTRFPGRNLLRWAASLELPGWLWLF